MLFAIFSKRKNSMKRISYKVIMAISIFISVSFGQNEEKPYLNYNNIEGERPEKINNLPYNNIHSNFELLSKGIHIDKIIYKNSYPGYDTAIIYDSSSTRKLSIYGGIGLAETFVIGIGTPILDILDFSIKSNFHVQQVYIVAAFSFGLGFKLTYLFSRDYFVNALSFEYSYLYDEPSHSSVELNSFSDLPGNVFEINIGNEEKSKGLFWYWYIGIAQTFLKNNISQTIPSIKFGLNWNLKF
jgi:hypothetical protein